MHKAPPPLFSMPMQKETMQYYIVGAFGVYVHFLSVSLKTNQSSLNIDQKLSTS